jgi:hypothetical protein
MASQPTIARGSIFFDDVIVHARAQIRIAVDNHVVDSARAVLVRVPNDTLDGAERVISHLCMRRNAPVQSAGSTPDASRRCREIASSNTAERRNLQNPRSSLKSGPIRDFQPILGRIKRKKWIPVLRICLGFLKAQALLLE